MRRLDLKPRKKLRNPARHVRALEKWSRELAGFFPSQEITYKGLWYEKIPIFEKVVSPPHTTLEIQKRCAQSMIDAAERLRDARPSSQEKGTRIYAYLTFPNMFGSFIEVAFESNPYLFFDMPDKTGRKGDAQSWREYFKIDDVRFNNLGLRIPEGFQVLGAGLREFDASWTSEPVESEEWAIGELHKY